MQGANRKRAPASCPAASCAIRNVFPERFPRGKVFGSQPSSPGESVRMRTPRESVREGVSPQPSTPGEMFRSPRRATWGAVRSRPSRDRSHRGERCGGVLVCVAGGFRILSAWRGSADAWPHGGADAPRSGCAAAGLRLRDRVAVRTRPRADAWPHGNVGLACLPVRLSRQDGRGDLP